MKSFKEYIKEESEEELAIYRLSGRPHLPSISVMDSKGNEHTATFHSELKDGKIRYDFTNAAQAAIKNGAWLEVGGNKVGEKELEFHHSRPFVGDVFTEGGGRGLSREGIMIMTYTPKGREDREPPAEPPDRNLGKARRVGPSVPRGRRSIARKTASKK